jgi:hypothetical protein
LWVAVRGQLTGAFTGSGILHGTDPLEGSPDAIIESILTDPSDWLRMSSQVNVSEEIGDSHYDGFDYVSVA